MADKDWRLGSHQEKVTVTEGLIVVAISVCRRRCNKRYVLFFTHLKGLLITQSLLNANLDLFAYFH